MNILKESFRFGTTTISEPIHFLDTTITLADNPFNSDGGVLVIDRINTNGMQTPSTREFISYQKVKRDKRGAWSLVNVTRGAFGSTANTHAAGAIIEAVPIMEQVHVQSREEFTLKNYLKKLL